MVPVPLSADTLDQLIDAGLLTEDAANDTDAVAGAIAEALKNSVTRNATGGPS